MFEASVGTKAEPNAVLWPSFESVDGGKMAWVGCVAYFSVFNWGFMVYWRLYSLFVFFFFYTFIIFLYWCPVCCFLFFLGVFFLILIFFSYNIFPFSFYFFIFSPILPFFFSFFFTIELLIRTLPRFIRFMFANQNVSLIRIRDPCFALVRHSFIHRDLKRVSVLLTFRWRG